MGRYFSHRIMLFTVIFSIFVIVFILATLFTSFSEKNLSISSSSPVTLGTPEFRTVAEGVARTQALPLENRIQVFNNGTLFHEDLLEEIKKATSSITFTNYIFETGVMTNTTFDALTKKAKSGVAVRLLLDAVGGMNAPEDKLEKLKEAGAKIEVFRPTNFRSLTRIHRRSHVRATVIDGKVGYIGGLAFRDDWLGDGTEGDNWRDLMFKFEGNDARAIQNQFNSLWRQTNGEILSGKAFYPDPTPSEEIVPDSYFIPLLHTPAPDVSADLLDLIWLSITGATEYIELATPYLTPPQEIIDALREAVERGVKVTLLVPGPKTDNRFIQSATRSYYETLLAGGVRIFEYQPGRFHGKWLTADGHWSLIGSPNMDNRSATLNVENLFGVEDKLLASDLEEEFATDLERSKEILPEDFHPNIFKRVYYSFTALLIRQL